MDALLDSLARDFQGDAARREPLDAVLRDGLPHARVEAWKYTTLRALERRAFEHAGPVAIDRGVLAAIPAPRLVFVNGHHDATLSDLAGLPAGIDVQPLSQLLQGSDARAVNFLARRYPRADEPFARLNAAFAREGAVVRVGDGVQAGQPLHVVTVGAPLAGDAAWHLRHFVELRAGALLQLVEHEIAGVAHAHLGNALMHVHLARDARLAHARLQSLPERATLFARTDAVLARDARYARCDLELGGALARNELNVRLEGEGARLSAGGVLLADGRRHLDTRLGIEHIARDTACELTWRGLAAGRGRAVFHGGILIRAGADGSNANLSSKNLLLSPGAEVDAQPVLEIHADEVQAAHGATVGQLDPTALFYLRSRGLPADQARRLLTSAFGHEALGALSDAGLRVLLAGALDAALSRLEAA
jgi:Fe-S cluster assembly protein SufD